MQNRQILLVSRPAAAASAENFRLVETTLPPLAEGQILVRNHYLSLDPYMRGRMNAGPSYAPPQPLDAVMQGGTAGVVEQSRNPAFTPGDQVVGALGWQEYAVTDGATLRRVDTAHVPLQAYLGAAGMPGVTAWYGLNHICAPKPGQTLVVSAASGAVGSVVGQLARRAGCRAIGIAGGPDKCAFVTNELGFDACLDYKAGNLPAALQAAAPDGVDAYFDNVGGDILNTVMARMNPHGRIAICGAIAGYDGQPLTMAEPRLILTLRLLLQGFIVSEHMDLWPQALAELAQSIAGDQLRYRETIATGLDSAVAAFLGLLRGQNFGKQLVKLT